MAASTGNKFGHPQGACGNPGCTGCNPNKATGTEPQVLLGDMGVVDADGVAEYPSLPVRLGGDGAEAESAVVVEVLEFAVDYCEAAGGARPGLCHPAAWNVECDFGWPLVSGTRGGRPHYWNEMPDGRIFDPTAAQFDGHDGPLITGADDARYVRSRGTRASR